MAIERPTGYRDVPATLREQRSNIGAWKQASVRALGGEDLLRKIEDRTNGTEIFSLEHRARVAEKQTRRIAGLYDYLHESTDPQVANYVMTNVTRKNVGIIIPVYNACDLETQNGQYLIALNNGFMKLTFVVEPGPSMKKYGVNIDFLGPGGRQMYVQDKNPIEDFRKHTKGMSLVLISSNSAHHELLDEVIQNSLTGLNLKKYRRREGSLDPHDLSQLHDSSTLLDYELDELAGTEGFGDILDKEYKR